MYVDMYAVKHPVPGILMTHGRQAGSRTVSQAIPPSDGESGLGASHKEFFGCNTYVDCKSGAGSSGNMRRMQWCYTSDHGDIYSGPLRI